MITTTFVFASFVILVWLASWGFSLLHSIHALSDDTLVLLETLETVLVSIDAALCVAVVLRGLWKYVLSVIRSDA